jgi:CheY-like chemotaxis protein
VLEVIKKIRPDILICDLAMPQMDGYEVLGNVRRLEPEVGWLPVIAFTASARTQDLTESCRAGFQAYLAKPLTPNEPVATIAKLVRMGTRNETDVSEPFAKARLLNVRHVGKITPKREKIVATNRVALR